MTAIVSIPRGWIQSTEWRQVGGAARQRSALTGRSRILLLAPAARWECRAQLRPHSANVSDIYWAEAEWAALMAPLRLGGARARLPATTAWQYPATGFHAGSLIPNGEFVNGAAGWVLHPSASWLRSSQPAPALDQISIYGSVGAAVASVLPPALSYGAAPLYVSISFYAVNIEGPLTVSIEQYRTPSELLQTTNLTTSGANYQWVRQYWAPFSPHPQTLYIRAVFSSAFGTGSGAIADFRVGHVPERAQVVSGGGQSITLGGLAVGAIHPVTGQMITVALPSGDEQLVQLTQTVVGNAAGQATVGLATPLRETPAAGATVELGRPWALMALRDFEVGWTAEPGAVVGPADVVFEEAF